MTASPAAGAAEAIAAVGLGAGLLPTAVAATNAAVTWNNRHGWFRTGTSSVAAGPAADIAPLWWHPSAGTFRRPAGQPVRRGRHRRLVPGAAGPPPRPGTRDVLRLARAGRAAAVHSGGLAVRPLSRPAGGFAAMRLVGATVGQDRLQIELALLAAQWLGAAVLRHVAPAPA